MPEIFRVAPLVKNVNVVPYTFVRRGVPAREDTYPEPLVCEIGWPVPFLPRIAEI